MAAERTKNGDATVFVGELDHRVTDSLLYELMIQTGRVINVHIPKDKLTQHHGGKGFVEFQTEEDAAYTIKIMNGVELFGRRIRVSKYFSAHENISDVGAILWVGNLDPQVDERVLIEMFSPYGRVSVKVARDESGRSLCYGFVSFDNFKSSDKAKEELNGQWLQNKNLSISYAKRKDKKQARHGSGPERELDASSSHSKPPSNHHSINNNNSNINTNNPPSRSNPPVSQPTSQPTPTPVTSQPVPNPAPVYPSQAQIAPNPGFGVPMAPNPHYMHAPGQMMPPVPMRAVPAGMNPMVPMNPMGYNPYSTAPYHGVPMQQPYHAPYHAVPVPQQQYPVTEYPAANPAAGTK
eukprot:TRINITY_DN25954_c0_g1_i1.p1 TRINITY_DN25954_c0_g1~~TRINITY_DN25954_c0_g1_i1.p1  ORF type:complete len:351 (-),score=93.29 TRINITY_DN25954_c0_g1_i1:21-1073(-)